MSFGNPDWEELARAFGWWGRRVESSADLEPTLREAVAHEGPALVVVPIDYREHPLLTKRLGQQRWTM